MSKVATYYRYAELGQLCVTLSITYSTNQFANTTGGSRLPRSPVPPPPPPPPPPRPPTPHSLPLGQCAGGSSTTWSGDRFSCTCDKISSNSFSHPTVFTCGAVRTISIIPLRVIANSSLFFWRPDLAAVHRICSAKNVVTTAYDTVFDISESARKPENIARVEVSQSSYHMSPPPH